MADNTIVCGNCQTENEPGADFCRNCEQPLTRSAEEGIVENQEAQADATSLAAPPPQQPGVATSFVPGTDTTIKEGLPTD